MSICIKVIILLCTLLITVSIAIAKCPNVKRSMHQRYLFMKYTGYPHGRHGYVVDHIVPLCAGGADAPGNMQWQTYAQSKVKDINEVHMCHMLWGHR